MHLSAVEATWDAGERLQWTKRAVQIAEDRLQSPELSIEAWERLEKLGDAVEQTTRALSDAYRAAAVGIGSPRSWNAPPISFPDPSAVFNSARWPRRACRVCATPSTRHRVIEKLLAERPDDPVTLLVQARVEARRRNWDALFKVGTRVPLKVATRVDDVTTYDLRRIAADALAHGGEHDRAAEVYDLILRERLGDKDATLAKERYLNQSGRIAELVDFLAARAELAEGTERGQLLTRAAEIAERDLGKPARAVELWEARARLPEGRTEALRALEALHETLGDDQGLRRDLEEQLDLSPSTSQRIELLRASVDTPRIACKTTRSPSVVGSRSSAPFPTIAPYATSSSRSIAVGGTSPRSIESSTRQGWRPADDSSIRVLWRSAAENVDEN